MIFDIFWRFLGLGLSSFGGPAAHVGYFRTAFVQRLDWLDDEAFARLVAVSQLLPGPASSQVGFGIGMRRAGIAGGLAAFAGFTLPSFVLMFALAVWSFDATGASTLHAVTHGLKLLAVVVVADATLGMFASFCTRKTTIAIAVSTAVLMLGAGGLIAQFTALVLAALSGTLLLRAPPPPPASHATRRGGASALGLFVALFVMLPFIAPPGGWLALFSTFFNAGSLVFGGGHVVLPLLQGFLGDSVDQDRFLLGYAGAQAIPGPMFTLAGFLGAELTPAAPLAGAAIATVALFMPGMLLLIAFERGFEPLVRRPAVGGAAAGVNAAVVGLLFAALYDPVFRSAVGQGQDLAMVVAGFFALRVLGLRILWLVGGFAILGWLSAS